MTSTSSEALQERFNLSGLACVSTGNGGQPCVRIESPTARGEIYPHGAHITAWQPACAANVIFTSSRARWGEHDAIRGGIPVCAPWFRGKSGDAQAPKHGLVRTRAWNLEGVEALGEDVRVTMSITNDAESRQWWPYEFTMRLRATFGATLHVELDYTNQASEGVTVAEALHTYLAVGDVRQVSIAGLDGARYLDNVDHSHEKRQDGDFHFAKETDNAYLDTATNLVVTDPSLDRRIHVGKSGSQSTVVWNPFVEGARSMADLGEGEWRQFACVEASNVLACALQLEPGETHTLATSLRVESL